MAYLALVRHGETSWNKLGLWTGRTDIELSDNGMREARMAADALKDIHFDAIFSSGLKRSMQTAEIMKKELGIDTTPTTVNSALNERDYGDYTGKNKWEIKKSKGEEFFLKLRRGWNFPVPNGETLKDVYDRLIPYYQSNVLPLLKDGKNVLFVSHGNNIRALVKYLEHISDDDIVHVELGTGEIYLYTLNNDGSISSKEIKNHLSVSGK